VDLVLKEENSLEKLSNFIFNLLTGQILPIPSSAVSVKISGPETIAPEITQKKPGDILVTYKPTKEEVYSIDILLGGTSIVQSRPIQVSWAGDQEDTEEEKEEFTLSFPIHLNLGKGTQKVSVCLGGFGAKGGKPVRFFLQFRDEQDKLVPTPLNVVGSKITGAETLETTISQRSQPGDYLVKYNPTKHYATYLVSILLGGHNILPKPVSVYFGDWPKIHYQLSVPLQKRRGFVSNTSSS